VAVFWPSLAPVVPTRVDNSMSVGERTAAFCLLLISLIAASCSGSGPDSSTQRATDDRSLETLGATEESPAPQPTAVATTGPVVAPTPRPAPTAIPIPEPIPEFGPTGRPTAAYDWFVNPTFFGNALAVMVLEGEPGDDWAKVQIPTRPIMQGWVNVEDFTWSSSNYYVQVDIGTNQVKVWNGDEVIVDEVAVVTGDVGRETPLASTYIDEIMPGPSGAYGPWLLSLGVFSEAINTFGSAGGLPKVAIHGTNRPDLLGQYASNGCIRLPNDVISMLAAEVPVGTRVDLIRSS
jgi:hypothetical protein